MKNAISLLTTALATSPDPDPDPDSIDFFIVDDEILVIKTPAEFRAYDLTGFAWLPAP